MTCSCGCGGKPSAGRVFISGHNLRCLVRTPQHRANIATAQRRAWATKRQRMQTGATWTDSGGYIRVKVTAGAGRWRLQHVLVMEGVLGRRIRPGEIIHHINGDRADNSPGNLFLCRSRQHHNEVHRSQDRALRELLEAGVVRFKDGVYEAVL